MNGFPARSPEKWIARATSSLPVPLSPWISTVLLRLAISWTSSKISCILGFFEMMSWKLYCLASRCRRIRFSRCRVLTLMIRPTSSEISSGLHGLTMYSCAPSFIAVIAVSTVAYAVMMMTEASGCSLRISIIVSRPSIPGGILRSTK